MGIRVVSCFDGIGSGMESLERVGIDVDRYCAFEINKNAIKVSNSNYPKIENYGDVVGYNFKEFRGFDLLIGGSPCQGFSIAGKRLNFKDERSRLFFEYKRALEEINPKYFIFENVLMDKDIEDAISSELGVKPVMINSKYSTGQVRKRNYFTNIDIDEELLPRKEIKLKDIIIDNKFDRDLGELLNRTEYAPTESTDGIITINPRNKEGKQTWQRGRVYDIKGYSPAICASLYDLNITSDHKSYRKLSINEIELLQGLPMDYTKGISKTERGKAIGNGWTIDVISSILKYTNL